MRHRDWLPTLMALAILTTGCATEREWAIWRAHPTHFATGGHLDFSASNAVGAAPQVTPKLMETAKGEGWWGRNVPRDVQLADVAGTWRGSWSGYGLMQSRRSGLAEASFTMNGATGQGRLVMQDSQVVEGIPLALRENASVGAAVEVAVSETELWLNGLEPRRPFAATFRLEGDRLIGNFVHGSQPVRIELVRVR
jgi:hypothetical protein